ncbi:MAG TPA: ATP-binding protein, partial [Roseiflexaceae bacterium]|nr:ATP-binding protein [Roseiflexaceae bacterium]
IAPDLPLASLDGVLIEQVLINLLENALKYSPAESPLSIRATLSDGAVLIEVADRGPGLPPGDEARIFEKFYRAPATQGQPGAGLGLAIAKGMVAAHGGRIWAENRPGGGAVFRFTLPLDGAAPPMPPEVEAHPTFDDRRLTVDD